MPITNHFYHGTTRKYIALFGSLFNKMMITRNDNAGVEKQKMIVPIAYGPFQKFLVKVLQDPKLDRPAAITLPRMSFEIVSMSYDGTRKLPSLNKIRNSITDTNFSYVPAPYNIEFNLYVMTKYAEDGTKILEQILPFFKPEYTFSAKLIDEISPLDIPLTLNSVSAEDMYEGDFETRRSLMWTLSFTMKAWFFGPTRSRSVIKFIDVHMHQNLESNSPVSSQMTLQPGLTETGEPTSSINDTIPYEEINFDDDWGVITIIREYDGDEE